MVSGPRVFYVVYLNKEVMNGVSRCMWLWIELGDWRRVALCRNSLI